MIIRIRSTAPRESIPLFYLSTRGRASLRYEPGEQRRWGTLSKSCLRHERTPVLSLSSLCVPPAMWSWQSDRPRNSLSPRNCCFEMSNEHTYAPIHSRGADTPPPMLRCRAHGNSPTRDNVPAMQGPNPLSQIFKRRTCVPFESSATLDALNPKPSASTVTNLADAHYCCYKMRRRPLSHNAVGNLLLGRDADCALNWKIRTTKKSGAHTSASACRCAAHADGCMRSRYLGRKHLGRGNFKSFCQGVDEDGRLLVGHMLLYEPAGSKTHAGNFERSQCMVVAARRCCTFQSAGARTNPPAAHLRLARAPNTPTGHTCFAYAHDRDTRSARCTDSSMPG